MVLNGAHIGALGALVAKEVDRYLSGYVRVSGADGRRVIFQPVVIFLYLVKGGIRVFDDLDEPRAGCIELGPDKAMVE